MRSSGMQNVMQRGLCVIVLGVLNVGALAGSVLHVDDDAPNGGDGSSWDMAYQHLQDALAAAESDTSITEIRVAQGGYTPDQGEDVEPGDRFASFHLVNGVALRGGYAGLGAPDPDAQEPEQYETILSGDLNGDDGADFKNNEENSYHVVRSTDVAAGTVLDGFTITAGNATGEEDERLGGGMFNISSDVQVLNSRFVSSRAEFGGAIYNRSSTIDLEDSQFNGNVAVEIGAAVRSFEQSDLTAVNCVFANNKNVDVNGGSGGAIAFFASGAVSVSQCVFDTNTATGPAGAIDIDSASSVSISDSVFIGNSSISAAIILLQYGGSSPATIKRCDFIENSGDVVCGAICAGASSGSEVRILDCRFIKNQSASFGSACILSSNVSLINCIFSQNVSGDANGAVFLAGDDINIVNCTWGGNLGGGVAYEEFSEATLTNCVLWNNTPTQIEEASGGPPPPPQSSGLMPVLSHCNVQGAWDGPGDANIDADPLFVQPGVHDLRLAFGSPCLDAGDNSAVPDDIETDLAGNPRIQNGIVDMGAYEGAFETQPPAAMDDNLDPGEAVILVPENVEFDPLNAPAVIVINENGPPDASVTVTQYDNTNLHPDAGGYSELSSILQIQTTLDDGQFYMRVLIPFTDEQLAGENPLDVDLTFFNPQTGDWERAVSANTVNSPDHDSPIGDEIIFEGENFPGFPQDLGDHGVFYNPILGQGVAFANVDHATDFAVGIPLCEADLVGDDDLIDSGDLNVLLKQWGSSISDADLNNDGTVGVVDLLILLMNWGACP